MTEAGTAGWVPWRWGVPRGVHASGPRRTRVALAVVTSGARDGSVAGHPDRRPGWCPALAGARPAAADARAQGRGEPVGHEVANEVAPATATDLLTTGSRHPHRPDHGPLRRARIGRSTKNSTLLDLVSSRKRLDDPVTPSRPPSRPLTPSSIRPNDPDRHHRPRRPSAWADHRGPGHPGAGAATGRCSVVPPGAAAQARALPGETPGPGARAAQPPAPSTRPGPRAAGQHRWLRVGGQGGEHCEPLAGAGAGGTAKPYPAAK